MEMARRPSEVVIHALTLKRLTSSVILVGGRSTYDGVCVEERELVVGSMDIHTCADTTRSQILMWDLKDSEKGRFGEGPTMTGELYK